MNFLFPFLAAVLQAGSFALDKVVLSVRRVSFKTYTGVSFPLIFFITLVIFLIFQPPLSFSLFSGKFFWLILLSIAFSIIINLIFYRALDADRLSEMQTIDLLKNIPIIIFAGFIFTDERNFIVILLALVSSVAIIWSHWQKDHFQIAKYTAPFLFCVIALSPLRAVISKELLTIWNPISLELVRSGAIALILGPLFFRYYQKISIKAFSLLIVTNILTSIAWILYYFSYQISGIIYTVLLFSLQPLLVYFASVFFLKESFHRKKFIAFIIILVSIIIAQITS
jgi:drug/metabolite transporter (DMT)-like permease